MSVEVARPVSPVRLTMNYNSEPNTVMTVQELSVLHRRYIDVSNRFRAAWTFHQYIQGLQKIFADEVEINPVLTRNMGEFQAIYNELKTLSQRLNASEAANVRSELRSEERRVGKECRSR